MKISGVCGDRAYGMWQGAEGCSRLGMAQEVLVTL